jgi:hypothetical protein
MEDSFMKSRTAISFFISACFSTLALANTPEQALEDKIEKHGRTLPIIEQRTLSEVVPALLELSNPQRTCHEASFQHNSKQFVTSYTIEGLPCRTYDLSFPTIETAVLSHVGSIPVQNFATENYSQWLENNSALERSVQQFQDSFSQSDLKNTWYGELRFKHAEETTSSPLEFPLSALELGIENILLQKEDAAGLLRLASLPGAPKEQILGIVENPESLLNAITLRWNDKSKVFDILANLQVLPITGPVALVDYNLQYKYAAEKLLRSALLNAVKYAVRFIPQPTLRNVISVAIQDTFEFVELQYANQMNRLEAILEANIAHSLPTNISQQDLAKGINILAAQRSALVEQYILARILKQNFDLNALDELGKAIRYQNAKTKESLRLRLHSNLVTKKSCETKIVFHDFAMCKSPTGSMELYSLLSTSKFLTKDFGATLIHNYDARARTMNARNLAWSLSAAARVMPLPIPAIVSTQLVSLAKTFATGGLLDDATLLGALEPEISSDSPSTFASDIAPWLWKQNIVPFAPKSFDAESKIIERNRIRLLSKINL